MFLISGLKVAFTVLVLSIVISNITDWLLGSDFISPTSCNKMTEAFEESKSNFRSKNMSAFVLGGTGEIGKELVKLLLKEKIFSKLVLIGRRKVDYTDEQYKDLEQRVIDFDNLEKHKEDFSGFDVGYSCLGTTRGKAGAEGFYKVDHDYVVNTARLAKDNGCKQFHLISSNGANKNAMLLYTKTKGEVEEEVKAMEFENLYIYRPMLLLCDREERRMGEKAVMVLSKPITTFFPTLLSVPTETVAAAMVNRTIVTKEPVTETLENKAIHMAAKCE